VARLDLCFVGISGEGDGGDEEAAVLFGRRVRWGIVVGAGAAPAAAQVALVRCMVEGRWVEEYLTQSHKDTKITGKEAQTVTFAR
jgi:hypothetical protein